MANLVARTDANLNIAPDRQKSSEKIDGAVALFMCFGMAIVGEVKEAPKKFQMFALGSR